MSNDRSEESDLRDSTAEVSENSWAYFRPLTRRRLRNGASRSSLSPFLAAILLGLFTVGLPGCEDDKSPLEKAAEDIGDGLEEAAEEIEDEIDDHT
jgi:hypothetical protein